MSAIQTPARAIHTAPAPGATGTGWGSPSDESQRRQLPVASTLLLGPWALPWLTVQISSTGQEPRTTSPAHPDRPTDTLRAVHRAAGRGASCAREHCRGRGPGARGRGGP